MSFKVSTIFEYSAWLLKKYNSLQQNQEKNIYRVIEIKYSTSGQYKIIAQIIGKSSIIECLPQEIISDDRILEGFSKKDIRMITYFACNPIKPKYKIISQEFSSETDVMIFKFKKLDDETIIIKTAGQVLIDKDMLNSLSKKDITSISYMAGYECAESNKIFYKVSD